MKTSEAPAQLIAQCQSKHNPPKIKGKKILKKKKKNVKKVIRYKKCVCAALGHGARRQIESRTYAFDSCVFLLL